MTQPFIPLRWAVRPEFRALLLQQYPGLQGFPQVPEGRPPCRNPFARLELLRYFVSSTFLDETTGSPVVSRDTIASIAGRHPKTPGFAADDYLKDFSENVAPLRITDNRYVDGEARTATPVFPPDIKTAFQDELEQSVTHDGGHRVDFVTGLPVSQRQRQKNHLEYIDRIEQVARDVSPDHPAYDLAQILNNQPHDTGEALFRRNHQPLIEAVFAMPQVTERQQGQRDWCLRLLFHLYESPRMYYKDSPKTTRLFAIGASIHQLPRDLRKIALYGTTSFDLRSSQLAIIANLWEVPRLQEFLEAKKSIWVELTTHLDLPISSKPILKTTLYSLCFGMSLPNLRTQLAEGTVTEDGIGWLKERKFFRHPLMAELLLARKRQTGLIKQATGGQDAFGRWLTTEEREVRSILAQQAQSVELSLMLPLVPILRSERSIRVVSWLHDGFTVYFGDKQKQERQTRRIVKAINEEARRKGILTGIEVELNEAKPTWN